MTKVIIEGFITEKIAIEFIKWYEGQGEQDFYTWCKEQDTLSEEEICNTDVDSTLTYPIYKDIDGNLRMVLENPL